MLVILASHGMYLPTHHGIHTVLPGTLHHHRASTRLPAHSWWIKAYRARAWGYRTTHSWKTSYRHPCYRQPLNDQQH